MRCRLLPTNAPSVPEKKKKKEKFPANHDVQGFVSLPRYFPTLRFNHSSLALALAEISNILLCPQRRFEEHLERSLPDPLIHLGEFTQRAWAAINRTSQCCSTSVRSRRPAKTKTAIHYLY